MSLWHIKKLALSNIIVDIDKDWGGYKIKNLGDPVDPNDAVRKADLDTLRDSLKHDIIQLVATAYADALSVTASRTVSLPRPFYITSVLRSGVSIHWGAFDYSYGSRGWRETPNYIIDGVVNPSLPVTANSSIGISLTVSNRYGHSYGVLVIIEATFVGYWL
jgi:hypothetical protein